MDAAAYFDFLDPLDIRFKGHRISVDDVLYYYLKGDTLDAILARYPSLTLDQIKAAIDYYQGHQPEMDRYLEAHAEWAAQRRARVEAEPPPVVLRLRALLQANREG